MSLNRKHLTSLLIGMGVAFAWGSAQAASISLMPVSGPVASGGQETFDFIANFGTQSVLAGGTDFSWDASVLTFQSFAFDPTFAALRDPTYDTKPNGSSDPWDLQAANLVTIGFGDFNGISIPVDTLIGTLTFNAVGAPGSSTQISLSDSVKWAGYYDADFFDPISVTYTGATASIAAVPLPASAWLFLSGLGVLWRTRFKRIGN